MLTNLVLAGATTGGADLTGAMTSAFNSVQSQCTSTVSAVLPVALAIMGMGIVVSFGVKFFKRFAK